MNESKFNEMVIARVMLWLLMMLRFHLCVMLWLSIPWFYSDSFFYEALNYNKQPAITAECSDKTGNPFFVQNSSVDASGSLIIFCFWGPWKNGWSYAFSE